MDSLRQAKLLFTTGSFKTSKEEPYEDKLNNGPIHPAQERTRAPLWRRPEGDFLVYSIRKTKEATWVWPPVAHCALDMQKVPTATYSQGLPVS